MSYNHLEGGDYMSTDNNNNNGGNTFETNSRKCDKEIHTFTKQKEKTQNPNPKPPKIKPEK